MSGDYARVHTVWEFNVLRNENGFSGEGFETIKTVIAEWADEFLITPHRLSKTDKGFGITIGTFSEKGAGGLAQNLFLTLAEKVFRNTNKSVLYRRKEN